MDLNPQDIGHPKIKILKSGINHYENLYIIYTKSVLIFEHCIDIFNFIN